MKRVISLLLCLLLAVMLTSAAFAAEVTPSVEQKGKTIDEDDVSAKTSGGTEIEVVTENHDNITWTEEIVITSVSILEKEEPKDYIGGNLDDSILEASSKEKVKEILEVAYDVMTDESKSLYTITRDSRFERDDLMVCDLFEVTYAIKSSAEEEFTKVVSNYSNVTLTFNGVKDTIVAVLHGNDTSTYWVPMQFKQEGETVTVYGFSSFSPVAFITVKTGTTTPDIQPIGGGGGGSGTGGTTVPTSPQTGEVPVAAVACGLGASMMGTCLALRRRKRA